MFKIFIFFLISYQYSEIIILHLFIYFLANYCFYIFMNLDVQQLIQVLKVFMLGTGINAIKGSKSIIKKSVYEDLEEKDLQRIIEEKDRQIRKLQYKIEKLQVEKDEMIKANITGSSETDKMLYFKEKITQEMKANDKAIQLFLETNGRIVRAIELLQTPSDLSEDMTEMRGLLEIMGGHSISVLMNSSSLSQSQISQNIQDIEVDVNKVLDELDLVTSQFRGAFQALQKHYIGLEKKNKLLNQEIKDKQKNYHDEIKDVNSKKDNFKKLLEKAEKQKSDLINSIANILTIEGAKELQNMDRNGFLSLIKKLFYRVKDLENQKRHFLKNSSKEKEMNMEKYQKILSQVKEAKEKSRLGMSAM